MLLVEFLASRGVDPNAVYFSGATPLAIFLRRDHSDSPAYVAAVKHLLDLGANVLQASHYFNRPIYIALWCMEPAAMRNDILKHCLVSLVDDIGRITLDKGTHLSRHRLVDFSESYLAFGFVERGNLSS